MLNFQPSKTGQFMKLSSTTIGNFELFTINTGDIKLDGGAMFGVVPKTLWSRGIEPDEMNRISMTMRCLLIKSSQTDKIYLIDNGAGTKFNEKLEKIYGLEYADKNLFNSLEYHGFKPDDITDIIFTHLHFDHCGGTTYFDESGALSFAFPNAKYYINKRHWHTATEPNAREKASFLKENIDPLKTSDSIVLVDDNHEYEAGLSTIMANGHTIGQQLPKIDGDGKTLVFMADLLPTHVHLPLPWVMGYDMYPTQTLLEKEAFMMQAIAGNWFLFLEHDLEKEVITVREENGKVVVDQFLSLSQV